MRLKAKILNLIFNLSNLTLMQLMIEMKHTLFLPINIIFKYIETHRWYENLRELCKDARYIVA